MSYVISITSDAEAFAAGAASFLGVELEREQLARILEGVLRGRYAERQNYFATVLDDHGELVAAALRTPPHGLTCTQLPDPGLAPELVDLWLARDPDVVGVGAEPETARAIAAAWARRTGGESHLHLSMAMHAASAIEDPPRPVAGRLRLAAPADRARLVRWWRAFYAEAEPLHPDDAEQAVAARFEDRALHVWEDGGQVVSLIGARLTGSGYGWIGPVYTRFGANFVDRVEAGEHHLQSSAREGLADPGCRPAGPRGSADAGRWPRGRVAAGHLGGVGDGLLTDSAPRHPHQRDHERRRHRARHPDHDRLGRGREAQLDRMHEGVGGVGTERA
jgi:predicted GNAT family acetyltransferase